MKTLLWILLLVIPSIVCAAGPEYTSSVTWVKTHVSTNQPVSKQCVYVLASFPGDAQPSASILTYTNGISLRNVIDQTGYKGASVRVIILRPRTPTVPVFDATVKAEEMPGVGLFSDDMIWMFRPLSAM